MKRKTWRILGAALGVVLLAAGIRMVTTSLSGGSIVQKSPVRIVMGTTAQVTAVGSDQAVLRTAIEAAFEEVSRIEELMSAHRQDSGLARINTEASERAVEVGPELFEVIERGVFFGEISGGAFDITVGPLMGLWKDAQENGTPPSADAIAEAEARIGYDKLILDPKKHTVRFAVAGMRLDLGGIAKGYALDRAAEAMRTAGASGGLVDIGGDIRCFGEYPPGRKMWSIGLQDPREEGHLVMVLEIPSDWAVATSGDYRRFTEIDGRRYSHIVNPDNAEAHSEFSSVTVLAQTAADADALATAVTVMGYETGFRLIEHLAGVEAIAISHENEIIRKSSGADYYTGEKP